MMRRRDVLTGSAAALVAPGISSAQKAKILKFRPVGDLAVQPQMAAGHVIEDNGRRWTITLREGLKFHDGDPVLARDAVASVRRSPGRAVGSGASGLCSASSRAMTRGPWHKRGCRLDHA
jgi:ABC-type transport system substrate-binding protein